MKLGFKRGQKGFTLVELMVVMAILAVLAAIVFPAVSGTSEVSVDTQTKQDASTVSNAINDYFADQTGAEIITSANTSILGSTTNQTKSSRWPEKFLTAGYPNTFQVDTTNVATINISLSDNTTKTPVELAGGWNAINLTALADGNYIPVIPKSSGDLSGSYHNYLWLVEKTTASGGVVGGSRAVQIFKLIKVVTGADTKHTLYYEQIY